MGMDQEDVAQMAREALDSARSAHHRLDELGKQVADVHSLAVAMGQMGERVEGLKGDMADVKKAVDKISGRPGRLWEIVESAVIGAIAAGVVGAIIALLK